jgi:PST family polysaccharide transporter
MNLDRILIGSLLGVEALGLYYFAVNAGSGLSLALIKAFSTVVLPDLSQQGRANKNLNWQSIYSNSLVKFSLIIVPIIVAQFVLSPFYVPIVFGAQWLNAIPVLMVLCAATIFHGLIEIGSQVLRAIPDTRKDIFLNAVFTSASFTAIGVGFCLTNNANEQLFYIVVAMLVTSVLFSVLHFFTVSKAATKATANNITFDSSDYSFSKLMNSCFKLITLHTIK